MFEIRRTDGSTCHLHFRKNGKMDAPSFAEPAQAAPGTSSTSSVSQPAVVSLEASAAPTVHTIAAILDTPSGHESQPVGKNEAHAACTRLLAADPQATSVDVTDGIAFPWRRFLRSQAGAREIVGPGVCRVCVVRCANKPSLAFQRTDGFIYVVTPVQLAYRSALRSCPPARGGTMGSYSSCGRFLDEDGLNRHFPGGDPILLDYKRYDPCFCPD